MSLSLQFLGTAASRPTVERNVCSLAVTREGETHLFDCGEGTQRQMMRYGVTFALDDIFFTHFHTDHVVGVVGLVRTFQLGGRTTPLRLWGPTGATRILKQHIFAGGGDRLGYPLEIAEMAAGDAVKRRDYEIRAFATDHRGTPSLGFTLVEYDRLGRFNPDLARAMGIPEGPLWGQIHRGLSVTLPDGRIVEPAELVGEKRPGRKIVITGDTRPSATTVDEAAGADVLVHEATFAEEESARAAETGHSTAREAAMVARAAQVDRLFLTHISARYSRDASDLEREARAVLPRSWIARDGMAVKIAYAADAAESADAAVPNGVAIDDGR